MADEASVDLVARWRNGDQQAATALFERYAQRLMSLAHRHLSARMAQRVAPEDVVQSVYWSFFAGARDGQYVLQRSGDLWRLLMAITRHKLQHQLKRHTADKRSIEREEYVENADSLVAMPAALLAKDPTPEEAVALADEVEQVMRRLEPVPRRIFELRLQGYRVEDIAAAIECCELTVLRHLKRVKQQLEHWHVEIPRRTAP